VARSQSSMVSIATRLWAGWRRVLILVGAGDFFSSEHPTVSRAHPAFYSRVFYWGKAAEA